MWPFRSIKKISTSQNKQGQKQFTTEKTQPVNTHTRMSIQLVIKDKQIKIERYNFLPFKLASHQNNDLYTMAVSEKMTKG